MSEFRVAIRSQADLTAALGVAESLMKNIKLLQQLGVETEENKAQLKAYVTELNAVASASKAYADSNRNSSDTTKTLAGSMMETAAAATATANAMIQQAEAQRKANEESERAAQFARNRPRGASASDDETDQAPTADEVAKADAAELNRLRALTGQGQIVSGDLQGPPLPPPAPPTPPPLPPPQVDASHTITTEAQLEGVERLIAIKTRERDAFAQGSAEYQRANQQLMGLTASTRTNEAQLVQQQRILTQQIAVYRQMGDAAGESAAKQQRAAIGHQLGQARPIFGGLIDEAKTLHSVYQQAGSGVAGLASAFANGGGAIAAWAVGIKMTAGYAKDAVKEYSEAEVALVGLHNTMAQNGILTESLKAKYDDLASTMSAATNIAGTRWVNALQKVTQHGADASNIDQVTEGVKNLAGMMNGNLEGASQMMGRALEGNYYGFRRLGIRVKEHGTEAEKLADLYEKLAKRGMGALEAQSQTLEGKTKAMSLAFHELKEGVGSAIVSFVPFIKDVPDWMATSAHGVTSALKTLFGATSENIVKNKEHVESVAAQKKAEEEHKKTMESIVTVLKDTKAAYDGLNKSIERKLKLDLALADAKLAGKLVDLDIEASRTGMTPAEKKRRKQAIEAQHDDEKFKLSQDALEKKAKAAQESREGLERNQLGLDEKLARIGDTARVSAEVAPVMAKISSIQKEIQDDNQKARDDTARIANGNFRPAIAAAETARIEQERADKEEANKRRLAGANRLKSELLTKYGLSPDAARGIQNIDEIETQLDHAKGIAKASIEKNEAEIKVFKDAEDAARDELKHNAAVRAKTSSSRSRKEANDAAIAARDEALSRRSAGLEATSSEARAKLSKGGLSATEIRDTNEILVKAEYEKRLLQLQQDYLKATLPEQRRKAIADFTILTQDLDKFNKSANRRNSGLGPMRLSGGLVVSTPSIQTRETTESGEGVYVQQWLDKIKELELNGDPQNQLPGSRIQLERQRDAARRRGLPVEPPMPRTATQGDQPPAQPAGNAAPPASAPSSSTSPLTTSVRGLSGATEEGFDATIIALQKSLQASNAAKDKIVELSQMFDELKERIDNA